MQILLTFEHIVFLLGFSLSLVLLSLMPANVSGISHYHELCLRSPLVEKILEKGSQKY